ncbi:MAG: metal-dependent transcriptional regulator [Candidatus Delongbacteria bacterium]|nr:metal-dependent transcriptional regulator [Candidatus Delongbacteria bacterium]
MKKLTFVLENYLEAIYELSRDGSGARVTDIADKLKVTKASTNRAMASLAQKGLIRNERYRVIHLTPEGLEQAEFTSRKHHTIRRFFIGVLGIDAEVADQDACAIEHVISCQSVFAMLKYLESFEPKTLSGNEDNSIRNCGENKIE